MEATLGAVIADPPQVHGNAPGGVWSTDRSCYEFLWDSSVAGQRTLETGCGVSTAVFAMRGTVHTAVFLHESEGEIFRRWAAERSVDISRVELRPGGSDVVLPRLPDDELDLVFIDGNHGFPFPVIDWFYSCSRLKQGGLLIVDDAYIAGVQRLIEYLDHDDRWEPLTADEKWRAYRRSGSGSLAEDWSSQRFLPGVKATDVARMHQARVYLHPLRLGAESFIRRIARAGRQDAP